MHRNASPSALAVCLLALLLIPALAPAQEFPLEAPVPLHPAEGEEVNASPVTFQWEPVQGFIPEFHVYRLTIAGTSTLGPVRPDPVDVNSTSAAVPLSIGAFYQYRLQVLDANTSIAVSPKSDPVNFTFPFPDPPTPTPTPTPIEVPQVDYNRDARIDHLDLWIFSEAWQQPLYSSPAASIDKDLVTDGFIDNQDLLLFLQIRDTALPAPVLVSPPDGMTFSVADAQQGRIIMEWVPVGGARSYSVRVEGPRPFPGEVYNVGPAVTSVVMVPSTLSGTYAWRVTAFDDAGRAGLPSRKGFFNIVRPSFASPTPSPTFTVTPTPTNSPTPTPTPTVAFTIDITGDGNITAEDLFTLAGVWQSVEGEPDYNEAADLVRDGSITQQDVFEFHRQWRARRFFEPTPRPSATPAVTPSVTPSPTPTATSAPSSTPAPTSSPTPTPAAATATPTVTVTATVTATVTVTPSPTLTPTVAPQ